MAKKWCFVSLLWTLISQAWNRLLRHFQCPKSSAGNPLAVAVFSFLFIFSLSLSSFVCLLLAIALLSLSLVLTFSFCSSFIFSIAFALLSSQWTLLSSFVLLWSRTDTQTDTQTDTLMEVYKFRSGLTEVTGDGTYICITMCQICFETLSYFRTSRAASSQLKITKHYPVYFSHAITLSEHNHLNK